MRWVFRHADKLLVTRDTVSLVPPRWRHKCLTELAIGLTTDYLNHVDAPEPRDNKSFRLLYVGRLLEWKGLELALHAVSELKESCPGIRFTIVGDGPARKRLQQLAEELEISEIVEWGPWLTHDNIRHYYRSEDLFLFPSLRDSGGMAVLEAMAYGLPVVCTDLGGPGVIVNQYCGRVVSTECRTRDQIESGLIGAIKEIADTPALRDSLATGASARARQFTFEGLVTSLYPPAILSNVTLIT
jgi:glycosyltransferase involved in cell wall biosynthesis